MNDIPVIEMKLQSYKFHSPPRRLKIKWAISKWRIVGNMCEEFGETGFWYIHNDFKIRIAYTNNEVVFAIKKIWCYFMYFMKRILRVYAEEALEEE